MAYIDKEKALTLDFKINVSMFESRRKTAERAVQAYANAISAIQAADVRPVVLCRDCKHNNACLTQAFVEDESRVPFDRNTFFCADGKRVDDA